MEELGILCANEIDQAVKLCTECYDCTDCDCVPCPDD